MEEKDLTGENIAGTLTELFSNRAHLVEMGEKGRALTKPNAAKELARIVFEAEGTRR
jgi:UDP-N-acetylglucosamine:LPS N-acetylglucosamine transferase